MLLVRFAEYGADLHRNGGPPRTARCRTRISPVFFNRPPDSPTPSRPCSHQHSQAGNGVKSWKNSLETRVKEKEDESGKHP